MGDRSGKKNRLSRTTRLQLSRNAYAYRVTAYQGGGASLDTAASSSTRVIVEVRIPYGSRNKLLRSRPRIEVQREILGGAPIVGNIE